MAIDEIRRAQIGKLDAAISQLKTSIRLWFREEDPVSAHTLAYAAFTILDDVTKARNPNRPGLLFDSPLFTQDDRELMRKVYRGPGNFFKHADRDPDGNLHFSSDLTRVILGFAIIALSIADDSVVADELAIFQAWSSFHHPSLRPQDTPFTDAFLAKFSADVFAMSKSEFFDFFTAVLEEIKSTIRARHE